MSAHARTLLAYLRRVAAPAVPDAALLGRWIHQRDQDAFAALMTRHGPMVLGVCHRLLGHEQDAEDVFQAVFVVLARRAGRLRRPESLAGFLCTVARRLARKARAAAKRRPVMQRPAELPEPFDPQPQPLDVLSGRELLALIDDEMARLPEVNRLPLLLCLLQGRTVEEAARQLGWSIGSLRGRLTRGREQLRQRLARRGLELSLGAVALLAPAAVPEKLLAEALRHLSGPIPAAVSTLAGGTISALKAKITFLAAILAAAVGLGAGLSFLSMPVPEKSDAPSPAVPPPQAKDEPSRDRYGDPLPPGAVVRLGTIRLRQGDSVSGLTFSPDGKTIASCNFWGHNDRSIYLWDVSSGQLLRRFLGHADSIGHLAFSPDGKTLASASSEPMIHLWDVATAKEVRRIITPARHNHFFAFSPDGRRLATTYDSHQGQEIALWDTATGQEVLHLQGHEKEALSLTFAPDGKSLASASQGPRLTLWDLASGKEIRRIEIGSAPVYWRPVAFTPDGKKLIAGRADNSLRLWDVATGAEVRAFRGHKQKAVRLVFSADGKILISAANDRTVRFWEVASGKERRAVSIAVGAFTFDRVAFSPGEKLLAVGGVNNAIRLFDTANGKELRPAGHQAPVSALTFSPDGQAVMSISWDRTFRRWDAATGRELRRSGGLKATLLSCPILPNPQQRAVSFLIYAACLSTDGRLLATGEGGGDARIHIWDTASRKEIRTFASNTGGVIALAFSPDGRAVASASWDNTVRLWDVATGKELRRYLGHIGATSPGNDGLYSVCFSADGRWLASSGGDRTVRVWEVATGKELHCLRHETCVFTTAFSPDGRMLAAAGSQHANEPPGYTGIVLWEMASGKERHRLAGGEWAIGALAFSPDGRSLASGSTNGTVRIWDALTGTERSRFAGHRGLVKSLAFSNDGRCLVSGGSDTTALIWDMNWLPAMARGGQLQKDIGERIWRDLAGADAARAYQAMARLAVSPDAVGLLKKRLRPIAPVDAEKISQWINDLDSDAFATREKASAELAELGDRAESALRRALGKAPSLEARRRIVALLDKLSSLEPQLLFSLRAVEALEYIGTPQARDMLRDLAAGEPGARLTREAKASLQRLKRRTTEPLPNGRGSAQSRDR